MKNIKPYYLLSSAVVFLVSSFVICKEVLFSINIHDTYYIISGVDFYRLAAILTFTSGLVYFILYKFNVRLISILSIIHVFGTLLSIISSIFFNYKNNLIFQSLRFEDVLNQVDYGFYLIISVILILFLQLLFIINIFVSLIKKMKSLCTSE